MPEDKISHLSGTVQKSALSKKNKQKKKKRRNISTGGR